MSWETEGHRWREAENRGVSWLLIITLPRVTLISTCHREGACEPVDREGQIIKPNATATSRHNASLAPAPNSLEWDEINCCCV